MLQLLPQLISISLSVNFLTLTMQLHIDNIVVLATFQLGTSLVPRPLPDFLHSCEIKYGSGLGMRLVTHLRKRHVFSINILHTT